MQDGSGSIETAELKSVIEKCGIEVTEAQVAEMIKEADSDGSGTLEFNEFLDLMWKLQQGPSERELRNEMFTVSNIGDSAHNFHRECRPRFAESSMQPSPRLLHSCMCLALTVCSFLTTTWTVLWRLVS